MSIYWPSTLPHRQFMGRVAPQEQTIRSQVDAGPPKVRRRFTAGVRHFDLPVRFRGDQVQAFVAWFETTLAAGALRFVWIDPLSRTQVDMRFRSTPAWEQSVAGQVPEKQQWTSTFELEVLP